MIWQHIWALSQLWKACVCFYSFPPVVVVQFFLWFISVCLLFRLLFLSEHISGAALCIFQHFGCSELSACWWVMSRVCLCIFSSVELPSCFTIPVLLFMSVGFCPTWPALVCLTTSSLRIHGSITTWWARPLTLLSQPPAPFTYLLYLVYLLKYLKLYQHLSTNDNKTQ